MGIKGVLYLSGWQDNGSGSFQFQQEAAAGYIFRFPDPLLKPNGTSAWRSDQFVYQSVAVFWLATVI